MLNLGVEGRFRSAARLAFVGGAVGAVAAPAAVHAEDKATQLQGVQVTGSLIRRVDTESANPVTTVSRKAIEASGVTTVGQLLQQLPSLTGDSLTPQVNNGGGGDGASTISLRGLGSARTLILLDGKRLVTNDVNTLPINMIDRVEVLNEGAGTVYGSDAVAGVVNFITRKNFSGTEITASYGGALDKGDATKFSSSFTTGISSDTGHMVLGISYDNAGAIKAPDRDVGEIVRAYNYGSISETVVGGSSRIPTGRFYTSLGQLTRIEGTDGSSADNFRPRIGSDIYNYQTENLLYTPNDHVQFFALGNQNFNDNLRGYASLLFNHTGGHNQLAPEAFDSSTLTDANGNQLLPVISQYSQYNPLGVDVTRFTFRATETGDRVSHASDNIYQGTLGLKATLLDRFEWDNSVTYGREDDTSTQYGYLNVAQLNQQLGPSRDGTCYTDGTFSTPINGCVPVNILGTYGNTYSGLSKPVTGTTSTDLVIADSSISGELFALPFLHADPISGAIGLEYRDFRLADNPDSAAQLFQLSESNSVATSGSYTVKEAYAEFLIPVLKDLPGAKSLNIDVGTRYSKYSNFGDTTNGKYAIEYRPIRDLLVRATYSDIFRAPTIADLYTGHSTTAPSYIDPCNGYTGSSDFYQHIAEACVGVPVGYSQADSQGNVIIGGNPDLKPEKGYTTDFGFVYSPQWYRPLSVQFDWWTYRIHDAIQSLGLQTYVTGCAASGDPLFCGNGTVSESPFVRDATGNIVSGTELPSNIGTFFTNGFDFGIQLSYPKTAYGSFTFDFNGTYVDKYTQSVLGANGQSVLNYSLAGQNDGSFAGGGVPRFKFTASLDWAYKNWDVVLRNRFVSGESDNGGQDGLGNYYGLDVSGVGSGLGYIGDKAGNEVYGITGVGRCNQGGERYTAIDNDGAFTGTPGQAVAYQCFRDSGYVDYQDVQVTYKAKPIHTDFTIGVNDLFDQGAPIAYTYGPAFNYDASNYDVTGRFLYARARVYFK